MASDLEHHVDHGRGERVPVHITRFGSGRSVVF